MPQISVLNHLMAEHIDMLQKLSPDEASRRLDPKELAEYREKAGRVGHRFMMLFTRGRAGSLAVEHGVEHYYEAVDTGPGIAHDGPVKVAALPVQVQAEGSNHLVPELRIYDASSNADRVDLITEGAVRLVGGCALDIQAPESAVGVRELYKARFLDHALGQALRSLESSALA